MENLNKDNFWDKMARTYPLAMGDFCAFIDEYKDKSEWDYLFNAGDISCANSSGCGGMEKSAPKFHDLPLAMQMGIWAEYLDKYDLEKCKTGIEAVFYGLEEGMYEAKQIGIKD